MKIIWTLRKQFRPDFQNHAIVRIFNKGLQKWT